MTELFDYWQEFPPSHELLLITSGYKPPSKAKGGDGAMDPLAFAMWTKSTKGRKLTPNG